MINRVTPQSMYKDLPTMMHVEEIAIYIGRTNNSVLRSIKDGHFFKAKKIGGSWYVHKEGALSILMFNNLAKYHIACDCFFGLFEAKILIFNNLQR